MNRQAFMNRLAAELSKLPKEEVQAAMEYYNEYFDEAGPEREQETMKELGGPSKIATQIKADYAVRQLDEPRGKGSAKKGISAIWWVILGAFAAPIAFPVAIALGALAFSIFISLAVAVICLIVSLICCCAGGIVFVIIGLVGLTASFSGGLVLIGGGLITAGITALLCVGVAIGARALFRAIVRQMRKKREHQKVSRKESGKDD